MKKYLSVLLILTVVLSLVAGGIFPKATPTEASPGTYYVDDVTGDNENNGSKGKPWLTIGYAISQASANDTIIVADGVYSENITIDVFGLTLKSADGSDNCTINATSAPNKAAVTIAADNVKLGVNGKGFTITGNATEKRHGIKLSGSGGTIDSNVINASQNGIQLVSGTENKIHRNTITGNDIGIQLAGIMGWNEVSYNDITNNTSFGIYADPVPGDPYWMQWAGFNWWGSDTGPDGAGPGTGDPVNAYVWYNPWLNSGYSAILASGIADISTAIPLEVGWNTLSTPLALAGERNQWHEISGNFTVAYTQAFVYDAATESWGELTTSNTTVLNPLDAVFVKMETDGLAIFKISTATHPPPTKDLLAGWNLIGAAMSITERELEMWKVLISVEQTPEGNIGYDMVVSPPLASQPPWVYVRGQELVDPETWEWERMQFGRGYWIYMENADEMAGFSSTPITARVWD